MSLHIAAKPGEIAERVLMPGDPLRAKYIADTYLEDVVLYSSVRNAFGYTGIYKGEKISIQTSGMGMPSMSIYAEELLRDYNVKKIIRTGTCGAMHPDINLRDIIVAQGATTDAGLVRSIFGTSINFAPMADFFLTKAAMDTAAEKALKVKIGNIISVDRFYDEDIDNAKLVKYGVLAVEMEAAALYLLAAKYKAAALTILTVSDHLASRETMSVEERQTKLNQMIELSLDTIIRA